MSDSTYTTDYTCEVAIIGGGVAGTYAGWRLLTDPGSKLASKKVTIFEMSDHIGGRLMSWRPFGKGTGFRAELGGMRFRKDQQMVYNLAGTRGLNLEIVPFHTNEDNADHDPSLDNSLLYLRGARTKYVPLKGAKPEQDPVIQRYQLENKTPSEKQFPTDLLKYAVTQMLQKSGLPGTKPSDWEKWTRADWDKMKSKLSYKDEPLWKWGFWNLLSLILSNEAYEFLADSLGYYSLIRNWNAEEALSFIAQDFAAKPEFFTLKEGYGYLPETLGERFCDKGGKIVRHHQLVKFESDGKEGFILHFRKTEGLQASESFYQEEPFYTTVWARKIILALPKWALQKLDFKMDEKLKNVISSVIGQPAFKMFFLYEKRWWEDKKSGWAGPIYHGHSVCDLPIRQIYYFRPDICEDPHLPEVGYRDYGLLMASYDDGAVVDYWRGMEEGPVQQRENRRELMKELQKLQKQSDISSLFSGLSSVSDQMLSDEQKQGYILPSYIRKAPQAMMMRAKEQIEQLHQRSTPEPVIAVYADWSLEPFDGGWNFWRPQFHALTIMKEMAEQGIHADKSKRPDVFIVGEAYCGLQGWVEGTLSQTEVILQNHFELKWPGWLDQEYYMGPGLRRKSASTGLKEQARV